MPTELTQRVALCTDTYDEINGVATICRQFVEFAQRRQIPLLVVRPGPQCRTVVEGAVTFVDVARSRFCLPLDMGLRFDLAIARRYGWVREQLQAFAPDVIHVCGPGDIGMLCTTLSHRMQSPKVPLVAAWHTNLHQYARLRMVPALRFLPPGMQRALHSKIEAGALRAAARFYRLARLILAPNEEILGQLTKLTGKPGQLLPHGVDTHVFCPQTAALEQRPVTLGYVGRLTPEKNVRFLADLARRLPAGLREQVRFLIVGDGSERPWLEANLTGARFTGVLRHGELAAAYAEMDLFLFPSRSDTFGLVVLEAMAAGLPVVAFQLSGPMCAVANGSTGFAALDDAEFIERVAGLVGDWHMRQAFGTAARSSAVSFGWDAVFESVYRGYRRVTA